MIHMIKFDRNEIDIDSMRDIFLKFKENLPEGDLIICLPYGIDWIYDYPIEELKSIHKHIGEYIKEQEA